MGVPARPFSFFLAAPRSALTKGRGPRKAKAKRMGERSWRASERDVRGELRGVRGGSERRGPRPHPWPAIPVASTGPATRGVRFFSSRYFLAVLFRRQSRWLVGRPRGGAGGSCCPFALSLGPAGWVAAPPALRPLLRFVFLTGAESHERPAGVGGLGGGVGGARRHQAGLSGTCPADSHARCVAVGPSLPRGRLLFFLLSLVPTDR